jgi:hypothetical protein
VITLLLGDGAWAAPLSAMSCATKVVTSLGECSPSRRIQSKPASPRISAAIGAASDAQHPIRRLPARRSARNWVGNGV